MKAVKAVLIVAIVVAFVSFAYGMLSTSGKSSSIDSAQPSEQSQQAQEESEQAEQVIDGQTMSVAVKKFENESMTDGVQLGLVATNNSGDDCTFAVDIQTATVNNTNVTPLGGSLAIVKPGNNVVLAYIVPYVQFGVESFDDVYALDFDIVQYAGDSMINSDGSSTEIDRVHVSLSK